MINTCKIKHFRLFLFHLLLFTRLFEIFWYFFDIAFDKNDSVKFIHISYKIIVHTTTSQNTQEYCICLLTYLSYHFYTN